jgi:hypothetical protein
MSTAPQPPGEESYPSRRQGWLESRLPAVIVVLTIGLFYQLVSARRTLGPSWMLLVLAIAMLAVIGIAEYRGLRRVTRLLSLAVTTAITLAVAFSATLLVVQALESHADALSLLADSLVLWVSNVPVFGLWYWELDAGGPDRRLPHRYVSRDFVFPQRSLEDARSAAWVPGLIDYVFLSFSTAMAFSPTDTAVLSRRAKLLMMAQTVISLLCIVVLAARALNTIGQSALLP